jgi:endonuclease-3
MKGYANPDLLRSSYRSLIAVPMTMPDDFYTIYKLVEELRADKTAPVDSDGAEALAVADPSDPRTFRFQTLVALMLSSQTKDAMVGKAMRQLQAYEKGGLTAQSVNDMSDEVLKSLIFGVGFHNNKTIWLKKAGEKGAIRHNPHF